MKSQLIAIVAAVLVVGCGGPPKDIWEAAKQGDIEAVKQYLDAGVDVNAKDKYGRTPLHMTPINGHKEIVELLISKGADVNVRDDLGGRTPLHQAASSGHKVAQQIAELLITKGADVNAKMEDGRTPLNFTESKEHKEIADLLRKHGGKTGEELSIHKAAEAGNIEAVKQHLAAGTDVNAKDKDGTTPLDRAIKDKKISDLLRNHGGKYSSIHIPSVAGNVEAVTEFLSNGADVNAKTKLGQTPLHMAALAGHKDVVELLISKGADVNAQRDDGGTPLDWAIEWGKTKTADLLRKHGGKTGEELKAEGK